MEKKLIKPENKYIVGVSGGPDSMYLLNNLVHYFKNYLDNLIIVHVNYKKRESSNRDQEIVTAYCLRNNLKFYTKVVMEEDYQKYYQYTHNFQTIAREIRYNYFNFINNQEHAFGVIIAHNKNDNIETYLLQKERKNIVEYYGLNKKSVYYSQFFSSNFVLPILRPMLNITRSEIETYLKKNNITFGIDETNLLGIYKRNVLRQKLEESNFSEYLLKIKQDNKRINIEKKNANQFFKENKFFNINKFNNIYDVTIKQRILYSFFKKEKVLYLINSKKKQYLLEVVKQLNVKKNNHLIKINSDFVLVKSLNELFIYPYNYFEPLTIEVVQMKKENQIIHWKNLILTFSKTFGTGKNLIKMSSFPLLITNDQTILKNVKFNGLILKDYWKKNRIDIVSKYNFWIIDINNECLFYFPLEKIKKIKKFNFMVK